MELRETPRQKFNENNISLDTLLSKVVSTPLNCSLFPRHRRAAVAVGSNLENEARYSGKDGYWLVERYRTVSYCREKKVAH